MILESFFQGLQAFGDGQLWLYMMIGVVDGLIIGIIPGIGTMLALSLFLPFLFGMNATNAMAMLIACIATNPIGGIVSTILLGVPGNVSNMATVQDGFAMTKRGESARAMGAALTSSGLSAIVGVLVCVAIIPLILPLIYALDSADMVLLIIMALSFLATLSSGSPIKGLIAGCIGMIVALVGQHMVSGDFRFTLGISYLNSGVPLIDVVLGLFAVPALFEVAATKSSSLTGITETSAGLRAVFVGVKDVFTHFGMWLKCLVIGWLIGILPGVGGSAAIWLCYGMAKQSSKYPEKFGKGVVEGVIAPECGANSENTGALLTTLVLGIPGSGTMVLILAALLSMNIIPGPNMMTDLLPLTFTTLQVLAVSAFLGAIICILASSYLVKLATIPVRVLMPVITILIFVGAYAVDGIFLDIIVCALFGVLGLAMSKYGFARPAMLLGFVMGDLLEKYLFITVRAAGPFFFTKWSCIILLLITITIYVYGPIMKFLKRKGTGKGVAA